MKHKKGEIHSGVRAGIWSLLSVVTFIVVFLSSIVNGCGGILPFVYASLALLGVLILEGLVRGRVWLFEPGYRDILSHPSTCTRLLIFAGAVLLVFETALLLGFLANPAFDDVMRGLIREKQCSRIYGRC